VEPAPLSDRAVGITFNVDPAGCRDIDDAITLHPIDSANTEVSIHIADVASWLYTNPGLVDKARAISQTLYRDGTAIRPMFPVELSEGKFSLLPGQDRRVVTLNFIWNKAQKEMSVPTWKMEMIRVSQSFTYHSVTKSMLSGELAEICSGIAGRPVTDSHEWIEQLMLLYNREAAKMLLAAGIGILRRHAGVLQERFDAYQALGLPADRLAMAAGEYCEASAADTKHWGLSTAAYCHASSPIRRWSDCANQKILQDIIAGRVPVPLHTDIAQMNARSKAVKAYERDLIFVRAVLEPSKKPIDGIVAEPGRVWVPRWGRIVKADTGEIQCGAAVGIKYFCDATKRNWKRRLVLKIEAAAAAAGNHND
jgi:exoribonuclease R